MKLRSRYRAWLVLVLGVTLLLHFSVAPRRVRSGRIHVARRSARPALQCQDRRRQAPVSTAGPLQLLQHEIAPGGVAYRLTAEGAGEWSITPGGIFPRYAVEQSIRVAVYRAQFDAPITLRFVLAPAID